MIINVHCLIFQNVDKTLLNRTFVRSSVLETLRCPETRTNASPKVENINLSGQEIKNFYESLTQCVTQKIEYSSLDSNLIKCSVCGGSFNDFKKHVSSIGHQVAEMSNKSSKPSPLLIPPSNKGYQLLSRIGWRDAALDPECEELKTLKVLSDNSTNESKSHFCIKNGGLGALRQGRRFPVATVLKRDRLGFGWPNTTNTARITHFNPGDLKAVEHPKDVRRLRHSSIKMDSKYLIRKMNLEKKKERIIRQGFNLTDEQLALLYDK
ncbi:unnamed protein product [Schistosoma rodhaini]|uniref:G-patch domain-containing protein n=1 Tax=Schistosoma mansoni TaxID=6183 RepID=G4VTR6_SCHMA|nr:hypothetical protein Smp_094470 [Schistosoma mansoni]CAH8671063.1 unnamed protein product [Schistosoma rodhaini]|eukprot:XP_018654660.1 hypothetical protein Smp_094470 [Schistosoma mansoni]